MMMAIWCRFNLFVWACFAATCARRISAGLTGLAMPPLDVSPLQYGGSWASANTLVFTNLMKHSSGWTFGTRAAGSNNSWGYLNPALVRMRADNYPAGLSAPSNTTQWSAVATIGKDGAYYRAGQYVVLYDGTGSLELRGDALWPPVSNTTGRVVVDVTPSTTGLSVRITSSSPFDPVVNIRIIPLANETNYQQNVFHPDFLDMLQGIPLLRFSAWMRTSYDYNNPRNAPRNWTDRTTPGHSSQIRDADGVAVEHLVTLANTVGANMWISLPRAANDTDPYIDGMVSYIAANLLLNLSLTVEYGIDGPGWLGSYLSTATRQLSAAVRRVWLAAGRSRGQLRMVMTTSGQSAANTLVYAGSDLSSYVDAYALPGSFGGNSYWAWAGKANPTYWYDPAYLRDIQPPDLNTTLKLLRSSVIAADTGYYKSYQWLRSLGVDVIVYMGGPDMYGPLYGARTNYDHAMATCGKNTTTFPCTWSNIYPPLAYSGGPSSITWNTSTAFNVTAQELAVNASREAAMESVLRQARLHDSMYDMVLDSLWRWHNQTGGGDFVIDLTRPARSCTSAPGYSTSTYAPDECKGIVNSTAKPTDTPTYRALMTWLAAVAVNGTAAAPGALPRSAAELATPAVPPPPACSPSCVYGSCVNGSCICWAGVSGTVCDSVAANYESANDTPSACNERVGINLEGISDWSRSWNFVNIFKVARAWIPQTFLPNGPWGTGAPISLINRTDGPGGRSAVGYPAVLAPTQKVTTLCNRDLQGHQPAGVYTILYDGKGSLDFGLSDVKEIVFVEAGHVRVTFKPSTDFNNGLAVSIERTDPFDPIRNIRVLMPGFEQDSEWGNQPFHPAFVNFLRPFGVIRFMDWMKSNLDQLPREWDERPSQEDISYATNLGGVPLELMLQLVNMLGADPWFNIPFAASDDYIAQFAAAVYDGLRPDLRVYVEYGNELWHTGFPGGRYAQAMGLALNTTVEGNRWYGGATNEARLCFVAQRTANISKIWKAVWANSSSSNARVGQVVVVVSGQAVWNITSDKLLSCGNASAHIDALAIAPYFGSYVATRDTNLTIFMNSTLPAQLNETLQLVKLHASIAAKYGKPLLAYEAGQGMTGDGSGNDLAIQANRHPAMTDIYKTYMEILAAANVSRIVHFSSIGSFSRYGSWGLIEAQDWDPKEAPKYQGLMSYLNSSLKCPLPELPYASNICPGAGCSGNGMCLPNGKCMCYSGYGGEDCSNVTYVEVYNCAYKCTFDQGWCNVSTIRARTRTWSCTCKPGITGLTCSIVACPNNCSRNGECLDQGICACYPGFKGPDCSVDCGCKDHGRCAAGNTTGCVCDLGWRLGSTGMCNQWDCKGCARGVSCIGPGECGCTTPCVYGSCFHGSCRCWAGYGGSACNVSEAEALALGVPYVPRLNRGSLAGANLGGTAYYTTEWIWIDVMKSSSEWMTGNSRDTALENPWDTKVPLELRSDGYPARLPPGTVAHKLLLRDMLLHVWPGRYVVLYDGDGHLDFDFDATVASRARNRMEIIFEPTADLACAATGAAYCGDNGIHLVLTDTNPANPLRNIRILPTAEAPASSAGGAGAGGAWESRLDRVSFHPWFLKSISRYSALRFMGWQDTNNNKSWAPVVAGNVSGWDARRRPNTDTQAGPGGIALEYLVRLCNMLGADPWVNVHHLADDAYVTSLATWLRDNLRPDVNVYVEHSNEVWNSLFSQAQYARARGLNLNLSSDPAIASYRYHALRTARIATIFRSIFSTPPPLGSIASSAPAPAPVSASAPVGSLPAANVTTPPSNGSMSVGADRVKVVLGGWGYLCGTNGTGCGAVVLNETLGWVGPLMQKAANSSANGSAAAASLLQQLNINTSLARPDFFGVTGYWDCGLGQNGAVDVGLSVEMMVAKCAAALNATEASARALVSAASRFGVPLISYEAGSSIVESAAIERGSMTTGLAAKFTSLNRHPAMYNLTLAYLEAYRRAGLVGDGRPFMQFVATGAFTQYGSWGLQEFTGQPARDAHKYRAMMDWLDRQANAVAGFLGRFSSDAVIGQFVADFISGGGGGVGGGGGSGFPICGCFANVTCNGTNCFFPQGIPRNGTACGCASTGGGAQIGICPGPGPANLTSPAPANQPSPAPGNLTCPGNLTSPAPANFSNVLPVNLTGTFNASACCLANITINGTAICSASVFGAGIAVCNVNLTTYDTSCCVGYTAPLGAGPGPGVQPPGPGGLPPGNGTPPPTNGTSLTIPGANTTAGLRDPALMPGRVFLRRPLCLSLSALGGPASGVSGSVGGGMALGEGVLMGPPAVSQPAAGQVVYMGLITRIRWAVLGLPPNQTSNTNLEITLWYESDCAAHPPSGFTQQEQQRPGSEALMVLPPATRPGELDVDFQLVSDNETLGYWMGVAAAANREAGQRVPRFFLRFSDGISTNYSEPFDISPTVEYVISNWTQCNCTGSGNVGGGSGSNIAALPAVSSQSGVALPSVQSYRSRSIIGCVAVPELGAISAWLMLAYNLSAPVPPPPQPVCDPFPYWNLSRPTNGDPHCSIDAYGCRTYRTNNLGTWPYSTNKPTTDCTAQRSPWPLPTTSNASLDAAAVLVAANSSASPQPYNISVCDSLIRGGPPPLKDSCTCDSSGSGPSPLPSSSAPVGPGGGGIGNNPGPSASPVLPSRSPPQPPMSYCARGSTTTALAALQAGVVTCTAAAAAVQADQSQQCGVDSECVPVAGCRRYICDPAVQALVPVPCEALCQPRSLTPLGARLSDDGRTVTVALSGAAAPLTSTPCDRVFESESANLLGGRGALCSTTTTSLNASALTALTGRAAAGNSSSSVAVPVLLIKLAASAMLRTGNSLMLLTRGSALVSALNASRAFTGNVTVTSCVPTCAAPRAVLSGPTSLTRTACDSATSMLMSAAALRPPTTFDASQSADPSGRASFVDVTWAVPGAQAGLSEGALSALQAAVNRSNAKRSVSDRLTLTLTSAEEMALDDGVSYTLQVSTSSWLGTNNTANISFSVVASNSAPTVTISGPAVQTVRINTGLRLTAGVLGGACRGRSLSWNWTSPSGWAGLSASRAATSGQQLSIRGPLANLTHGQSVTLRVTATYAATGGSVAASGSADVVVVASGSPPRASLIGPAGDILDDEALLLNATASSDPDAPSDPRRDLLYLWDCRREDYPTPCFNSSQQGDSISNPGVWTIPARLLSSDIWHTVTVTVYKQVVEGATQLNATSALTFRPRSASVPFPRATLTRRCAASACAAPHNTARDLTVLLQLEPPHDTATDSVVLAWASQEAVGVGNLTAKAASDGAFVLTIPSEMLPAAQSSVTITANMTVTSSGLSGSAVVTVGLNGAPYCTESASNASACLAVTVLNATFPAAAFELRARGWTDVGATDLSSAQLKYEFGVRQSVVRSSGGSNSGNANSNGAIVTNRVQQFGTATSVTLVGLPQGVVQLYGCAIDVDGSRACATVNVTVEPPAAGFNATAALAAVNVTDLLQANDQRSLLQAASQMAQLALVAATSGGGGSGNATADAAAVSELVGSMGVALVQAMMSGGALQDAEQAPQAIAAMASLAASAADLPDSAKDAFMLAVMSAAGTLGGTPTPTNSTTSADNTTTSTTSTSSGDALDSFLLQLCSLLGATLPTAALSTSNSTSASAKSTSTASNTASSQQLRRQLVDSQPDTYIAAWNRLKDMLTVSDQIGNALSEQAEPLGPALVTGDNGVFVAAVALPTTEATTSSGAEVVVVVELSAGPAAVSSANSDNSGSASSSSSDAAARLVLTGNAAVSGAGYGIDLQYTPSSAPALATATAQSLPAAVSILSGLVTVSWNPGSGAASAPPNLDGSVSFLTVTIPAAGYNTTKATACLFYNVSTNAVSGNLSGPPALVVPASGTTAPTPPMYNATTGRLSCNVNVAGSYFIAQASRVSEQEKGQTDKASGGDVKKQTLNVPVLVGGVVGGVVGLMLLAAVVIAVALTAAKRSRRGAQVAAAGDTGGGGHSRSFNQKGPLPTVDDDPQGASISKAVGERVESERLRRVGHFNQVVPIRSSTDSGASLSSGGATSSTLRTKAALARQVSIKD